MLCWMSRAQDAVDKIVEVGHLKGKAIYPCRTLTTGLVGKEGNYNRQSCSKERCDAQ